MPADGAWREGIPRTPCDPASEPQRHADDDGVAARPWKPTKKSLSELGAEGGEAQPTALPPAVRRTRRAGRVGRAITWSFLGGEGEGDETCGCVHPTLHGAGRRRRVCCAQRLCRRGAAETPFAAGQYSPRCYPVRCDPSPSPTGNGHQRPLERGVGPPYDAMLGSQGQGCRKRPPNAPYPPRSIDAGPRTGELGSGHQEWRMEARVQGGLG